MPCATTNPTSNSPPDPVTLKERSMRGKSVVSEAQQINLAIDLIYTLFDPRIRY